jgi:hypothetical protein
MAAPYDPKALGPCPSDEELAAFLDGMLPAAERARITAHLADCESCFEVFASAVHFQQEAAGREGGDRKVLPFAPKRQVLLRPWWWGSLAAAALVAVGLGIGGYRWYFGEPAATVADLMAPLAGRPGLADHLDLSVLRGTQPQGGILPGPAEFMAGDRLVELQVSLALGQSGTAANVLREMSGYLKQTFSRVDQEQCLQDALTLYHDGSPQTLRRIAEAWSAKEAKLDADLPSTFAFGKWAEAGRLAAATQTPDFFASWRNRRFLRALLKDSDAMDKEAFQALERIRAVWDRGGLQDEDYKTLAETFAQIIRLYRMQASSADF